MTILCFFNDLCSHLVHYSLRDVSTRGADISNSIICDGFGDLEIQGHSS